MHSSRRRKKRASNGVKGVSLCRGRNGFGFTISGQFPCKLSCVVNGSPADDVGLKPGDYLIAVNGINVAKTPHDEVVHLIGSSDGILHLQISDNYVSDTSDEDCPPAARARPRYPGNKSRHKYKNASLSQLPSHPLNRSAFSDELGVDPFHDTSGMGRLHRNHHAVSESVLHPPMRRSPRKRDRIINASRARMSMGANVRDSDTFSGASSEILMRTVVGYLGTIGMPKDSHMIPNSRLQAVRSCIRRLRIEKKVHTLVLFSVLPDKITLQNPHGMILAAYPSDRVTFCGAYADDNKFFGIVTRSSATVEDREGGGRTPTRRTNASSSCHVFMVDAKMHFHSDHAKRARAFRVECSRVESSEESGYQCAEFPSSAAPILQAIVKYWGRSFQGADSGAAAPGLVNADSSSNNLPQPEPNASPQPSLTSSNSDSGIGFRDDALSCQDREGVLDYSGSHLMGAEAFPVEFDSAHVDSYGSVDRRAINASETSLADRLCVRAMPSSPSSSSLLQNVKSTNVDTRLSAQVYSNPEASRRLNMNYTRSLDDIRLDDQNSASCSGDCVNCHSFDGPSRSNASVNFHGSESNLSIRGQMRRETNIDDVSSLSWDRGYSHVHRLRAPDFDMAVDYCDVPAEDKAELESKLRELYDSVNCKADSGSDTDSSGSNDSQDADVDVDDDDAFYGDELREARIMGDEHLMAVTATDGSIRAIDRHLDYPWLSRNVELARDPERGRYLVARKQIQPGDVLVSAEPHVKVLHPANWTTHCHLCFAFCYNALPCDKCSKVIFCSPDCAKSAEKFHSVECSIMGIIEKCISKDPSRELGTHLRLRMITAYTLSELLALEDRLRENYDPSKSTMGPGGDRIHTSMNMIPQPKDLKGYFAFHCLHMRRMEDRPALYGKAVEASAMVKLLEAGGYFKDSKDLAHDIGYIGWLLFIHCIGSRHQMYNESEVVIPPGGAKEMSTRDLGLSITPMVNFVNHACFPNATLTFFGARHNQVRAILPISPGEEITISYTQAMHSNTTSERRQSLQDDWGFICDCVACASDWPPAWNCPAGISFHCPHCRAVDELTASVARASDDEEPGARERLLEDQQQSSSGAPEASSVDDRQQHQHRHPDPLWASLSDGLAHLDSQGFLRPLPPAEYALQLRQQQQHQHQHHHHHHHQLSSSSANSSRSAVSGRPPRGPSPVTTTVSCSALSASSLGLSVGASVSASSSSSATVLSARRRARQDSGASEKNFPQAWQEQQPSIDHRRVHSDTVALQLSEMVADLSRTGGATCAGFESSSAGGSSSMASSAAADQTPAAIGRVESWSMSFEALLKDSAGIHTFAEYLKKEFSHENIYFWVAVQRYKALYEKDGENQEGNVTDKEKEERVSMAREIYERHLSPSAVEAVNVDCHAQKFIGDNYPRADGHLFDKAEQQVFSLMKYDTYVRFLKSQMYKDALQADSDGRELPFPGGDQMEADLRVDATGGQAEGDSHNETVNQKHVGRRRSLLGWGKRSRAKSRESRPRSRTRAPRASSLRRLRPKDQKAQESVEAPSNHQYQQQQKSVAPPAPSVRDGSVHSNTSRMSLASSDLAMMSRNFSTSQESLQSEKECVANASTLSVSSNGKDNQTAPLCRMILPDQSTTVVPLTPGETIRALITRLLGKKGLHYSATDVYTINSNVPIDQTKDSLVLSCQEVRVERRVLIRFIFPGDRPFAVKVGPGRKLYEVLRPILSAHNSELQRVNQQTAGSSRSLSHLPNFKPDHFTAHRVGEETSLSMKTLATNLDNETVVLKYKEGAHGNPLSGRGLLGAAGAKKLDEITNRVFLDLMRSKSVTDADKVPTDDSSSQSSGICGSLIRRNSIHIDRDISVKALTPPQPGQNPETRGATGVSHGQESLLKSVLSPPRLFLDDPTDQPSPSREELYMELKKADKLRLDDQRGTKLNCEIPEFLRMQPSASVTVEDKENELKNRTVRMDESDFLRGTSSGSFMSSRSGETSSMADASSLYDYAANMLEVSHSIYGTRRNPNSSTSSSVMADSDRLQPYGIIDVPPTAARRITTRRTAIGIPSNAEAMENIYEPAPVGSRQNKRILASHQMSPPPPLPPKPKTFRAPPCLRPPPPPPPHRRGGDFEPINDGLDYLAPPRAVRRSDRLNSSSSMTTASAKPMPNISFV